MSDEKIGQDEQNAPEKLSPRALREHVYLPLPEEKGRVIYIPHFLSPERATKLFQWCKDNLPFAPHKIRIYGREVDQPRLTCMLGKHPYKYSGKVLDSQVEIPAKLEKVIDRMMKYLPPGHPRFNGILCNLYRSGNDYISKHSDDEKDLGVDTYICGLSMGAEREFIFYEKLPGKKDREAYRVKLEHGSLVGMGPGIQQHYMHSVPKRAGINKERINLTFRVMVSQKNQ